MTGAEGDETLKLNLQTEELLNFMRLAALGAKTESRGSIPNFSREAVFSVVNYLRDNSNKEERSEEDPEEYTPYISSLLLPDEDFTVFHMLDTNLLVLSLYNLRACGGTGEPIEVIMNFSSSERTEVNFDKQSIEALKGSAIIVEEFFSS